MLRERYACPMHVVLQELTTFLQAPFEEHGLWSDDFEFIVEKRKTLWLHCPPHGERYEYEAEEPDEELEYEEVSVERYHFIDVRILNSEQEEVGFFRIDDEGVRRPNDNGAGIQLRRASTDPKRKHAPNEWRFVRALDRSFRNHMKQHLTINASGQPSLLQATTSLHEAEPSDAQVPVDFLCDVILHLRRINELAAPAKNSHPHAWIQYYYAVKLAGNKLTIAEIAQQTHRSERTVEGWKVEFDARYQQYKRALENVNGFIRGDKQD
jgi:hypothetical protein